MMRTPPLAYMLTLRTYGTWLHGDARGSVDRAHRAYGTPMLGANGSLERAERARPRHAPVQLDAAQRRSMTETIQKVCLHRNWTLYALSVRTEHVHIVVAIAAKLSPEKAMNTLKSWITRCMVEQGLIPQGNRVWARHGSTRYLWSLEGIDEACRYVLDGQGEPLRTAP